MPSGPLQVEVYLSGGAANEDPQAALGGAKSSTVLASQDVTWASTSMAGVTLHDGGGQAAGTGILTYDPVAGLGWAPPASVVGSYHMPGADGRYAIAGSGDAGILVVQVTVASLPAGLTTCSVTVAHRNLNLFDAVTAEESRVGDISYRCLYLQNLTASAGQLKAWLQAAPSGPDRWALGFGSPGVQAPLLGEEHDTPAGIVFTEPTSSVAAITASLGAAGSGTEWVALWLRRTVAELTSDPAPLDLGHLLVQLI